MEPTRMFACALTGMRFLVITYPNGHVLIIFEYSAFLKHRCKLYTVECSKFGPQFFLTKVFNVK